MEKRNTHYILEYIAQGIKPADIARTLGISRQRVTQVLKAHGINYRLGELVPTREVYTEHGGRPRAIPEQTRADMRASFEAGDSIKQIARQFGCSYGSVYRIINNE